MKSIRRFFYNAADDWGMLWDFAVCAFWAVSFLAGAIVILHVLRSFQ